MPVKTARPNQAGRPDRIRSEQEQRSKPIVKRDGIGAEEQSEEILFSFTTAEGEVIEFSETRMPLADVTARASEDVLGRCWNAPAEDGAWHGM